MAQTTKANLGVYNNAYFNSNGIGAITGPILNTMNWDFINSFCGLAQSSDCVLPAGVLTQLQGAPHVATNAALTAASTASFPNGVWRDDYAAGYGAPPLFYEPTASGCSLNSGAGDGGSQVPTSDGKCWAARFSGSTYDVRDWGALANTAFSATANGATTGCNGAANFCSATAAFVSSDQGKQVLVWGGQALTPIVPPATPIPGESYLVGASSQTYYVRATYVGSGGETTLSNEALPYTTTANFALSVPSPAATFGAYSWNVYVSTSSGSETKQNIQPLLIGQTWTAGPLGLISGDAMPSSNTTDATAPLLASISAVVDSHDVTLSPAPTNTSDTAAPWGYGTDDWQAIQSALAACGAQGGGLVSLGAGGNFLAYGLTSSFVVPTGCTLGSSNRLNNQSSSYTVFSGPTLYENPSYPVTVSTQASGAISGLSIIAWGVPMLNASSTTRQWLDAYSNFAGTGVYFNSTSAPSLDHAQIIGFAQCLNSYATQRITVENVFEDCTAGDKIVSDADYSFMKWVEHWQFYTHNTATASTSYTISGASYIGSNITVTIPTSNVLKVGDPIVISGANEAELNNRWTVGATSGGVVTLLDSVLSPTPTWTWVAGANAIQVVSTANVAHGDTLTAAGIGPGGSNNQNTVSGVDIHQNLIRLANPTVAAGTNVTVTVSHVAFSGTATLNLIAGEHGGDATYIADSAGMQMDTIGTFGWQVGFHFNAATKGNGALNAVNLECDGWSDPNTDCIDVTSSVANDSSVDITNVYSSSSIGNPLWLDSYYLAADYANGSSIENAAFYGHPATTSIGSIGSGQPSLSGSVMGGTGASLFVGAGVARLTLPGDNFSRATVAEAAATVNNVSLDPSTSIIILSGGHLAQYFSANGTYYLPFNAVSVRVVGCGGGGGGGSGAVTASLTSSSGGGGGGGGGCFDRTFPASEISSPVTIVIGAGGAGGAAVSSGAGNPGGIGSSDTAFGALALATPGGGGAGGQSNAASGGGGSGIGCGNLGASSCAGGATAAGSTGGNGAATTFLLGTVGNGGSGAGGGSSLYFQIGSGGGGGQNGSSGTNGGDTLLSCGGGAAGGGVSGAPASEVGANGGSAWGAGSGSALAKGGAGSASSAANGGSTTPGQIDVPASGAGGGYGNASGNGTNGGAGVQCGGAGGGGSALTGSTSGAGGVGGAGWLEVFANF